MTNITDLLQEFWTPSNGAAVGTSFFAMRSGYLLEILQKCLDSLEVRLILFPFLRLLST